MFKTLDADGSGTLSIEELKTGFAKEFKVDALAPHVRTAMSRTDPHAHALFLLWRDLFRTLAWAPLPHPCASRGGGSGLVLGPASRALRCCLLCAFARLVMQVLARMDEMFGAHADEKDGEKVLALALAV